MKRAHHTPWHSDTRHNTRQHGTPHQSAPRCNAPQQGTPQHDTPQHDTARRGRARRSQQRDSTTHHGTTRRDTARQSRAHRNTGQTSTAQHGKARHDTARRTKAHHSTKARDTNRGSNPSKPPHAPEGEQTRPQPWDNATPACRTLARGHRTHGNDNDGPTTETATRKLQPAPHRRRDTENPTPLNQDVTKPPGATAQPAEPEPNLTGKAKCVHSQAN